MDATEDLYACAILPLSGELGAAVASVRNLSLPQGLDIPPHITVLPPFRLPAEDLPAVGEAIKDVARSAVGFTVANGAVRSFEPVSPVVYLDITRGRDEIVHLHQELFTAVPRAEFRFPFVPHITIAQAESPELLRAAQDEVTGLAATSEIDHLRLFVGPTLQDWREVFRVDFAS